MLPHADEENTKPTIEWKDAVLVFIIGFHIVEIVQPLKQKIFGEGQFMGEMGL